MAALLQTAPVWLGEPIGYLLAIFASLPIAIAAVAHPRVAPLGLLVATLLCLLIKPQEAWVLACTNGLFGLALGARHPLRWWQRVLRAAGALLLGICILTWGVGVAALGPDLVARGVLVTLGVYVVFALGWATLFSSLFGLIYRRIAPLLRTNSDSTRESQTDRHPDG
jgi:hypothetical protein